MRWSETQRGASTRKWKSFREALRNTRIGGIAATKCNVLSHENVCRSLGYVCDLGKKVMLNVHSIALRLLVRGILD